MGKRRRTVLKAVLLLGALFGAGLGPTVTPALGQTSEETSGQARDRALRELSTGIQKRNERLQSLERELGTLKRKKDKADSGKRPGYDAKIGRLKDERNRLHRANQLDQLERNRLRGRR